MTRAARIRSLASRAGKLALLALIAAWLLAGPALPSLWGCAGGIVSVSGDGSRIDIPSDVPQSGTYTITGYDTFLGVWDSGTAQDEVSRLWVEKGSEWEDHIAVVDGFYLVACAETFGSVGDKVVFELTDGTQIPTIIADIKSSSDPNYSIWGHVLPSGQVSVLEWEASEEYFRSHGGTNPGANGWKEEWGGKAVQSATNYGSVFTSGTGGVTAGLSSCSASPTSPDLEYLEHALRIAGNDAYGYVWGGLGPDGFDCQGLVKYCLEQAGWDVSPWTGRPGKGTYTAEAGLSEMGFDILDYEGAELERGDILIYDAGADSVEGHVAIYCGGGEVVEAAGDFDGGAPGDTYGNEIAVDPLSSATPWQLVARPPSAQASGLASCSADLLEGDLAGAEAWQREIVETAREMPPSGIDMCAEWVTRVYQAAGRESLPAGNACDMYYQCCDSSNRADLEPGMVVAVPSCDTNAAGREFGHVGIYVGDGNVMHSIGTAVLTETLDEWIAQYGTLAQVKWGFPPN